MNKNILLIFPKLGPYDNIIKDMPLSLIYASRIVEKNGFQVTIIDQRLHSDWRRLVKDELERKPILAGLSVMTGGPIQYALEASKFIKDNSGIPVVWGGIHPTIAPDQTLENSFIDIVVRGDGEFTLHELADTLWHTGDISSIKGISFKRTERSYTQEQGLGLTRQRCLYRITIS